MSFLDLVLNTTVAHVTIKDKDDAIKHLLEIIDKSDVKLDDYDEAVINRIKYMM